MRTVIESRDEELHVELLTHIRDFELWIRPLGIHPHGCFVSREKIDAPHSFIYKLRMDMSHREVTECARTERVLLFPHSGYDVMCLTKHFMASTTTNPPVLIIPNSRFPSITAAPGGSCYRSEPVTEKRRKELRDLAQALEEFTAIWDTAHSYLRAAADLRNLADGRDECRSEDGFLEAQDPPSRQPVIASTNPYFGNLPDAVWNMAVTFRRR